MTPRKRRRLYMLSAGLVGVGIAAFLVLNALSDSIVFFYSPTTLAQKAPGFDRPLRIGGLVEMHTLERAPGNTVLFKVTDGSRDVRVRYRGLLPDLFREGQGVVAEGRLGPDGLFVADTILAKHDEKYMPPEVAAALKASGQWRGNEAAAAKASPAL